MKVRTTNLPGVLLVVPDVHQDHRGYFLESWQQQRYADAGIDLPFVQDNLSHSTRGTLRGLHLQNPHQQGKLVSVFEGAVFDVAVDLRQDSPHYRDWVGYELSGQNHWQLWIPPGFAHGFCVTSENALFGYKCTEVYDRESELHVAWNDPSLAIDWPIVNPDLSEKDRNASLLTEIEPSRLPTYDG